MNAMTNALKEAKVELPSLKYRVWNWLRDHPEKTAEEIQKALGMPRPISGDMSVMEARGIVKVYSDISRKQGLKGVQYRVKRYSVVNKDKYELPPPPKKVKPKAAPAPKPVVVHKPSRPPVRDVLGTGPADTPKPKAKVELTEAEKFAAFLEFKQMMKEMK